MPPNTLSCSTFVQIVGLSAPSCRLDWYTAAVPWLYRLVPLRRLSLVVYYYYVPTYKQYNTYTGTRECAESQEIGTEQRGTEPGLPSPHPLDTNAASSIVDCTVAASLSLDILLVDRIPPPAPYPSKVLIIVLQRANGLIRAGSVIVQLSTFHHDTPRLLHLPIFSLLPLP
ncbi:hypothetical protein VTI28DRAFT_2035 [Corynascus sepedonium]